MKYLASIIKAIICVSISYISPEEEESGKGKLSCIEDVSDASLFVQHKDSTRRQKDKIADSGSLILVPIASWFVFRNSTEDGQLLCVDEKQ